MPHRNNLLLLAGLFALSLVISATSGIAAPSRVAPKKENIPKTAPEPTELRNLLMKGLNQIFNGNDVSSIANLPDNEREQIMQRYNDRERQLLSWNHSLLFKQSDIDKINEALRTYALGLDQPAQKAEPELTEPEPQAPTQAQPEEPAVDVSNYAPSFFLNSIMYLSDQNWSVWINGKRISYDTKEQAEPAIISISPTEVLIRWKSFAIDRLSPNWRSILVEDPDMFQHFYSPDRRIMYDRTKGEIFISLKPNQTFQSSEMLILEGKLN